MKKLLAIPMVAACAFVSCKKSASVTPSTPKTTSAIVVPAGFDWSNSRDLSFVVNISDAQFAGGTHIISIYEASIANGGKLLTKGTATTIAAYQGKIYLSNQIKEVLVVSTAPDNTSVTKVVTVATGVVNLLLAN